MNAAQTTSIPKPTPTKKSLTTSTITNYNEIFQGVDWHSTNLIDLEDQWNQQLDDIEKENVRLLIESTNKAQILLPFIQEAIDEIHALGSVYDQYANQLRKTGIEIQQIETLNTGLKMQAENQEKLYNLIKSLVDLVELPDDVLKTLSTLPFDEPGAIDKIESAAATLYKLLGTTFDGGVHDIKAISDRLKYFNDNHNLFAKRILDFFTKNFNSISAQTTFRPSGLKLSQHDSILSFLVTYRRLISLCKTQCPREHFELCSSYQYGVKKLIATDFNVFFDTLRSTKLVKRPIGEPHTLFINANSKSSSFTSAPNVTPMAKNFASLRLLVKEDLPTLKDNEFLLPDQCFHFIILTIALHMSNQYNQCLDIFFGISIDHSVSHQSLDLKISKKLDAMIAVMFSSLGEKLPQFIDQCIKLDESCAIDILAVIDSRLEEINIKLPILGKIISSIQTKQTRLVEAFLTMQIEAIKSNTYSPKKRSGIFNYVETFPLFISRFEKILAQCDPSGTGFCRSILTNYYDKIGNTIFESFDRLAAQVEDDDEKGHINASVMTIENTHHLFNQLKALKIPSLDRIVKNSRHSYEQSLKTYASYSIYRVLQRYTEFFGNLFSTLKTTPPEEVAFTSTFSKANVKKMLQSFGLREMKKAVELMHQRVLKHFDDRKSLGLVVWTAVQEEFLERQRSIKDAIDKIFPNSQEVTLPYTFDELGQLFSDMTK